MTNVKLKSYRVYFSFGKYLQLFSILVAISCETKIKFLQYIRSKRNTICAYEQLALLQK